MIAVAISLSFFFAISPSKSQSWHGRPLTWFFANISKRTFMRKLRPKRSGCAEYLLPDQLRICFHIMARSSSTGSKTRLGATEEWHGR